MKKELSNKDIAKLVKIMRKGCDTTCWECPIQKEFISERKKRNVHRHIKTNLCSIFSKRFAKDILDGIPSNRIFEALL